MKRARALCTLGALCSLAPLALAERPDEHGRAPRASELQRDEEQRPLAPPRSALEREDEAARAALGRALAWLAAQTRESDGSLPVADADIGASVAVTALASLAWMAGGNIPDRGPQGHALGNAVDWLAAHADLSEPSMPSGYISSSSDLVSRMHGHGFATLALAEAWCMSPTTARGKRIESALEAAVHCIEKSQGIEGGWWYQPQKGLNHEGSITIAAVQALRAARNAGVKVDTLVIARATDYVARSQKDDGSFRYALGDEHSSVALTAAALSTLNAAGTYDGKILRNGYDYLVRELAAREKDGVWGAQAADPKDGQHVSCPYYERLYLAQAFWQAQDRSLFSTWYGRERTRVLALQDKDGSWTDPRYGKCYATAMNALFLALPDGLLPIFQR
ncbi:MAG: hypothetical protein IPJ19_20495 [Planctomycetes bacterium]|nr:hypothetical protein [Planctomycetota bacterium]